jgi:ABC-type lipoprotein release transport system permease subunit
MLLILAWRNIWRNKRRSFIIISAISVGILCGLFASAIMFGMGDSLVNSTIDRDLGHIQIHSEKFEDEKLLTDTIPDIESVVRNITQQNNIIGYTSRIVIEGMGSSASTSNGLRIVGINPREEKSVTSIHKQLITGNYFTGENTRGNQIVIGEKLAENFGIKEKSKIVLSFQGFDGSIIYGAFRVIGIFRTESTLFDKTNVFIKKDDLYSLLGSRSFAHEISIRLSSVQAVDSIYANLTKTLEDVSVKNWKDLAPDLKLMDELIGVQLNIFLGIILFALLFGITNTMLMSVLERVREFGVLMAIGMKRRRVFSMIIIETISLSLVGGIIGIICSSILIAYFGSVGINLSGFAKGFTAWNLSPVLQPELPVYFYFSITIMIVVTAILSAVYPAIKAIKLNPANAIRTY